MQRKWRFVRVEIYAQLFATGREENREKRRWNKVIHPLMFKIP
jgi:hypothetical protein